MSRAWVLLLLAASACGDPICIDRGKVTTYAGSYTFTTSAGATGAAATELLIDDFDPYGKGDCDPAHAEFTMTVGTCRLVANATSAEHDTGKRASGDFLSAAADVAPGQTCTLALGGKPVEVSIVGGGLALTPGNAVLDATGHIASTAPDTLDTITISFHGH